jgi:integrase/recombinase XerD
MTTAAPSTALATIQPVFTDAERLALAGFLAGYRGLTIEAYTLDPRQFTTWCRACSLNLFAARCCTGRDLHMRANRLLEPRGWQRGVTTPPLRAAWPVITMRCIRPTARIWPGTLEPERGGGLILAAAFRPCRARQGQAGLHRPASS